MSLVRPLGAVRPRPDVAEHVASVPYDVVDAQEARRLAADNPLSFLHVVRSEIDLPESTDPHDPAVYHRAAETYQQLQQEGALLRDSEPALYLYRQVMGPHSQVSVVGCCSVDDYDGGYIKKHEKTRPDKEEDRTRHILALGAHPEPVFLTYRGRPEIDELVAGVMASQPPLYDFVAADGVRHTVWRVTRHQPLTHAFAAVDALYIADGHHRSASASQARARLRAQHPSNHGPAPCDVFPAALFPADQVQILPYNRVIHDLAGQSSKRFLARLAEQMSVRSGGVPSPPSRGRFGMYLEGAWYALEAPGERLGLQDPVASLDAAILQEQVLGPLLEIEDPRTSERIELVGGIRGTGELERRVDARPGSIAFSLYPVTVEQLLEVADFGRELPPKSTWFEPKLRSGLLIHDFSLAAAQEGDSG